MDNLTHSLFALTLGRTPLGRVGRGATAALLIASNIPDIDFVAAAGGGASYMHWHRGPTHGPLSIVALGIPAAGLAWLWTRFMERRRKDPPKDAAAPFATLVAISMMAVVLHLLMDFPTSYGTRLLSPFDWHWFALDWMPIVDVYLLVALGFGLLVANKSEESRRKAAVVVLTLMAIDYGVRAAAHHTAMAAAPTMFGPLAAPCTSYRPPPIAPEIWPRAEPETTPQSTEGCLVSVSAMPTFLSPLIWRIVTQRANGYEIHELNLLDAMSKASSGPRERLYFPNEWTPQVTKAAAAPLAQTYLGFSRFPAARSFVDSTGAVTVHWNDMRFVGGMLELTQPGRQVFSAVVKLDPGGKVVEQQFGP